MLSRAEIERVAETLTRGDAGQAEKLYLQDIILETVSRETADQLVFMGGTALLKFYQLDRFSEDLDFTAQDQISVAEVVGKAVRDLENYGATIEDRRDDETDEMASTRLGIQGPLYTGDRRSLCFIRIEVNTRSTASLVRTRRYNPLFRDVPSFELAVLDEEEILAEKVRALMTRHAPRDLYDIYHLLERSVRLDPALVQEKLDYYGLEFSPASVLERARTLEDRWETLGPLVYSPLPPFADAYRALDDHLAGPDESR